MKRRPVVHACFTAASWLIALVYRGMINDVTLWAYLICRRVNLTLRQTACGVNGAHIKSKFDGLFLTPYMCLINSIFLLAIFQIIFAKN